MTSKIAPTMNADTPQVHTCYWKIKNFSYCNHKNGEAIRSPFFVIDSVKDMKLSLCIIPRAKPNNKFIGCSLNPQLNGNETQKTIESVEFSLLDVNNVVLKTIKLDKFLCEVGKQYGRLEFISREEVFDRKSTLLPQDTLTIRCIIVTYNCDSMHTSLSDVKNYLMQTQICVNRKLYVWKIKDLLSMQSSEQKTMTIGFEYFNKFFLSITLTDDHKYKIEIHAVPITRCFMICKISVIDSYQTVHMTTSDDFFFENEKEEVVWTFPDLITKRLENDALTLHCEFSSSFGYETSNLRNDITITGAEIDVSSDRLETLKVAPKTTLYSPTNLTNDLWNLYKEGKFCDVVLQTHDKEFLMHKAVLCSTSSVFCAMFERDMKEKENERVSLPDLDEGTVDRMVLFMYKREVSDLQWPTALKLYHASDLYEILSLKQACSSFLKSNLSNSNVCEVVVLADLHQDEGLAISAREYIFCNGGEILRSEKWKSLEKTHPHLTIDILRSMYLKKFEV